jgi:hypothetical protein
LVNPNDQRRISWRAGVEGSGQAARLFGVFNIARKEDHTTDTPIGNQLGEIIGQRQPIKTREEQLARLRLRRHP